jgi:hypothetical protein
LLADPLERKLLGCLLPMVVLAMLQVALLL